jgi:hypothetical protein
MTAEMRVQIVASATIADHEFHVRGAIPSIMENAPVDMSIELGLASRFDSWYPAEILSPLTKGSSVWNSGRCYYSSLFWERIKPLISISF